MGRWLAMSFVTETPVRERAWSAGGAALIVALVSYGLVSGLRVSPFRQVQQALAMIDIAAPPPPPPRHQEVVHRIAENAKGKPSPPNLRNKATPIVAPPPPPVTIPPPVIAAPKPNVGMALQTGASDRAGPGQGAGGQGNGYGGGGDGGDGGDVAPEPIRDQLKMSWLPPEVRQTITSTMAIVHVRYSVEIDGRIGACRVTRSSGNAPLDAATCAAIQQHFKYRPARDSDGKPFATDIVTTEGWQIDRDGYDQPSRSGP